MRKLDYSLERGGLEPAGTIVDLGAGTCWLSAALVRRPGVEESIAIEFSRRRLEELAPIAIAYLVRPRRRSSGSGPTSTTTASSERIADWVFTDAAFHHAPDPSGWRGWGTTS